MKKFSLFKNNTEYTQFINEYKTKTFGFREQAQHTQVQIQHTPIQVPPTPIQAPPTQVQQAQVKQTQVQEAQAPPTQAKQTQAKQTQAKQTQAKQAQAQQMQAQPIKAKEEQAIKIIDLFATSFIENIITALADILRDCGITVNIHIRNLTNADIQKCKQMDGRFLFICCPQTLLQAQTGAVYPSSLEPLPARKYFLYQLEHLDIKSEKNMNPHMTQLIKNSKHTFEYSEINLAYYPEEVKANVSILLPPVVNWTTTKTLTKKKYDILFCGYINKRRENILNELRTAGYKVLHVDKTFGAELTQLIREARLFFNIHHSNSKSLETCRLNEAVMSPDTHIVSEKSGGDPVEKMYVGRVYFTEKKDILKTVKEVMTGGLKYSSLGNTFNQLKFLTETSIFNTLKIEYENKKLSHRYNCSSRLRLIRNVLIPTIKRDGINETVLIEFRPLPHLEFLLRNTILKLPDWSHTVVCGNVNYVFIKTICDDISKNIRIIQLDIDNLTPSDYSKLLMTSAFWLNFVGEKILLYQEDTILFHNRIAEFLNYDYVGAAWPVGQDDNSYGVGNGGFSLRTKAKMLECIEQVNPTSLKLGQSTIGYMKATQSHHLPEDVFFSKALIDYKLGLVAPRDVANRFSQETQLCHNPLGGHNFWLATGNKLNNYYTLVLHTDYYKTVKHRGGWKSIITNMLENNVIHTNNDTSFVTNYFKNNIKFIDCVEAFFIWNNTNKPITEDWIGCIHYSPSLPIFLPHCLDLVLNNSILLQSLKYCKCLIVLSKNSLTYIKKHNEYKHINVLHLKHPLILSEYKFSLNKFIEKENYNVIQLGLQDRKVTTIYALNTKYSKIWMPGTNVVNNYIHRLNNETDYLNTNINLNDVSIKYFTNVNEYDSMLLNNIIIIPLWSASANNSVMEIIALNVPAFVTRLPATEEYLGKDYPMFFTDNSEIENIINNRDKLHDIVKRTYTYLLNMDKREYALDYFKSEIAKLIMLMR